MNSTLATSFLHLKTTSMNPSSLSHFISLKSHKPNTNFSSISSLRTVRASSDHTHRPSVLKSLTKAAILIGFTVSVAARFSVLPARAETSPTLTENRPTLDEEEEAEREKQKLENGEDEEALKVLERLVDAQPSVTEWKFLIARKAVIRRLQEALDIAKEENKVKEARDVRFIMAQIQFLQKNVEEALKSYQELSKEDPNDFRPYFCRGMIYSLLDKNEEAREQFAKYRKLSPKKFEVEGYLRTPLSRMKLFGSNEEK
ncbi:hypothetical protein GH714_032331 [Hevea brasiliensis]|uniref:Uncharacterized protein n=1 Tax=Hevea brasiliensis TaxID=3981 RepID=A0A6A6N8T5_HEVBR|nr:hypothetical protein GH714_032331 [Hevea brasiliensis]